MALMEAPSPQLQRNCLIVSRDQAYIDQMQELVKYLKGEIFVATSWWEANRLGQVGLIDMVGGTRRWRRRSGRAAYNRSLAGPGSL